MHPTTFILALTTLIATASADCSASWAAPDDGEIALYRDQNCNGNWLNVGALNSCQSWPNFDACSAKTRAGIVCDIYEEDNCPTGDDHIATIDSDGHRNFCGNYRENVQSLRCRVA